MRKYALLLALPFFSGCSIMAHTPMTRFESPEVRGEAWKLEGQIGYQGRNEIKLTDDFTRRAPNLSAPSVEGPGHRLMGSAATGVHEAIDVSISLPEARLGVKVQLLGDPQNRAAVGNFPLAVYAGFGATGEEESNRSLFVASAGDATYKLQETSADIGLVLGYRPTQILLLYGGPFIVWNHLKVNHRPSPGAVDTEAEKTARVYGANFGFQVNADERLFLRVEAAGSRTEMGSTTSTRGTYGASLGAYF